MSTLLVVVRVVAWWPCVAQHNTRASAIVQGAIMLTRMGPGCQDECDDIETPGNGRAGRGASLDRGVGRATALPQHAGRVRHRPEDVRRVVREPRFDRPPRRPGDDGCLRCRTRG